MNTTPSFSCSQCGSPLIKMSSVTERIDGSLFPQTTSTFRCSNEACQSERDKETEKRLKQMKEKEIAGEKRQKERDEKKEKLKLERIAT